MNRDLVIIPRNDRTICIFIDSTSDNGTALFYTEWFYIRTAAAKAHAQRRSSSDYHVMSPFLTSS